MCAGAAALATLATAAPPARAADPVFAAPQSVQMPFDPGYVFTADFNHDGRPDLAAETPSFIGGDSNGHLTVRLALAAGGFAAPQSFAIPIGSVKPVVADANGDGKPDVVSASSGLGIMAIGVALGDGAGGFTVQGLTTRNDPYAVAVADFTGDGIPDLALANRSTGGQTGISVYRGNSAGWAHWADYEAVGAVRGLAAADLNHDGKPDLVASADDGAHSFVSVLLNSGVATAPFATHADYPTTGRFQDALLVKDLDGDGALDVALPTGAGIGVLRGKPGGTLAPEADYPAATVASVAAADVNGDGILDLVGDRPDGFTVLLGRADGTYGPETVHTVAGSVAADFGTVADVTGDGRPDVIEPTSANTLSILANRTQTAVASAPAASRSHAIPVSYTLPAFAAEVASVDLYAKGPLDGSFTKFATVTPGVSTVVYQATEGDGAYGFYAAGVTADGHALDAPTAADAVTQLTAQSTLTAQAPDFGSQDIGVAGDPHAVTVTNTGQEPLRVSGPTAGGDFAITADGCNGPVAPGGQCTIALRFTPGDIGPRGGTLSFTANTADPATHTVALTGTGTAPPTTLSVDAPAIGALLVGTTSGPEAVTIANTGAQPLHVADVAITGADAGDYAVSADGCRGVTIAPDGRCTVTVRFTPGGPGARPATLSFLANTAGGSAHSVDLGGTGAEPSVAPAPPPAPPVAVTPVVAPRRVIASLVFKAKPGRNATTLRSLVVKGFPSGATVVAKLGKKTVRIRNAHGAVSLKALIRKPLKAGTRLTVTVSKAGMATVTKTLTIRARKAPKVTTRY